jgi:phosphate-selective porin OprO/OprP
LAFFVLLFLFFCIIPIANSQISELENIKNNDIRLSALPYYSFGKGHGITSPDSIFQFNIRFRMQNRVSYIKN